MGAEQFFTAAKGKTATQAFAAAVTQAEYDHGHSGYTGTIAEKGEYVKMGTAANMEEAHRMAERFIEDGDPRIDDKWGAAGCIEIKLTPYQTPTEFLFFGWASS